MCISCEICQKLDCFHMLREKQTRKLPTIWGVVLSEGAIFWVLVELAVTLQSKCACESTGVHRSLIILCNQDQTP